MFDIDFHRMTITIVLVGAVIGGAVVALVLLAWPWALAKPALHAWITTASAFQWQGLQKQLRF